MHLQTALVHLNALMLLSEEVAWPELEGRGEEEDEEEERRRRRGRGRGGKEEEEEEGEKEMWKLPARTPWSQPLLVQDPL